MLSEKYVSRSSEDQELMKGESAEVHSPLAYIKYIQGQAWPKDWIFLVSKRSEPSTSAVFL